MTTLNRNKIMKTKTYIKNILVGLVFLAATNCTSDLEKLNVDPTSSDQGSFNPNFILTTAQLRYTGSADFSYETWRTQLIHFSTMMQHFSHVAGYWVGDKYLSNPGYQSSYWERAYDEQVKPIVDLVEQLKGKTQYANLYQIARIWKVVIFHRITDIYGDVPYFDAGQGYYKGILKPKYDDQQAIYADMLKELDEAAAALDASKDKPTGDMIYKGDINQWKKFAYSMMLRLGTRLSKVDAANSKKYIEKAATGGVMTSIADNALVQHDKTNGRPTVNRISQVLNLPYEIPNIRWSKTFIDFLKNNNDPRLSALAELPPAAPDNNTVGVVGDFTAANQLGMPNGYDLGGSTTDIKNAPGYPGAVGADPLGKYSRPRNTLLAKMDGPTFILTYGEVELMLAEAAQLGYTVPGTATTHYNAGVTAAMKTLEQFDAGAAIPDASVTAYLAAHPYVPGASGLSMIGSQYWAATIFNDYETFANWRRTGFPALVPVNYPNNVTGGVIPRRLVYPQAEAASNGDNYNAAVAKVTGGNTLTGRVWWDK